MVRLTGRQNPIWIVLLGAAGVALIMALGWLVWSHSVRATRTLADNIEIPAPSLQPPALPPAPKLPDMPIPKPQ